MKLAVGLLVLVLALGVAAEITLPYEDVSSIFASYVTRHNKKYSVTELFERLTVFKQNYEFILNHNAKPEDQRKGVELGVNHLTDMTREEYRKLLGFKLGNQQYGRSFVGLEGEVDPTASVDWRTKGAVNPVKDQQQCGSCWAFSAVAAAEGAIKVAGKPLPSLSEQELVDCTNNEKYGCQGCSGCLMANAFQYMIDSKGLCTEAEYKYTGTDGTCKAKTCKSKKVPITSYTNITCANENFCDKPLLKGNETTMAEAVDQGVLSIAIEADSDVFQSYKSGILDDASCGTQLDHGVAIVGYGVDGKKPYWIVRNSWGSSWGDKGYIKIARGKNTCGIATYSNQPYAD